MRVLYVYEHLTMYGGVERILIDKMNYLVNIYNEKVYLLTYNQGCHQMQFQIDEKINYTDLGIMTYLSYRYHGLHRLWDKYRRLYLFKKKLKDYINQLNPDIIFTTTIGPINYLLKMKGSARLIIESHGGYEYIMDLPNHSVLNRYKYSLQKRRIMKADGVVSLTEGDACLWRRIHNHVVVIPNFIHFNDEGIYSTLENKKVIYVGRLFYQKAIPDLVEIWKLVNKRHPDWCLEIYGKGALEGFLNDAIKSNSYNIVCHPPTSDIFRFYINSSIFVIASFYESFSLVIGEAMSCGLPVVAFNCPFGPAEQIVNGENGFLVENRDIEVFADRVCQLIENVELRKRMGQNGLISVQRYKPEKIMPIWKEFMESMVYG